MSSCAGLTFLWLLRTEGVTKAFSHRSHLYFLCPSCTTWMCTFSVSFLLKVASHWSHLKVLSPAPGDNTHTHTHTHTHTEKHSSEGQPPCPHPRHKGPLGLGGRPTHGQSWLLFLQK